MRPSLPVIMWNETHAHRRNPWVTGYCHLSMSFNWCTIESVSIFGGAESKLTDRPWQEAVMVSACWALFIVSPPVTGNDPQLTYKKKRLRRTPPPHSHTHAHTHWARHECMTDDELHVNSVLNDLVFRAESGWRWSTVYIWEINLMQHKERNMQ